MTKALMLPGVKSTAVRVINESLKSMVVLPNRQQFRWVLDQKVKDAMFAVPAGLLRVHLVAAKDLRATDSARLEAKYCSPYVKLQLGAKEVRSKIIRQRTDPVWDQIFDFIVTETEGQTLNLSIFNDETDDLLGKSRTRKLNCTNNTVKSCFSLDLQYFGSTSQENDLCRGFFVTNAWLTV